MNRHKDISFLSWWEGIGILLILFANFLLLCQSKEHEAENKFNGILLAEQFPLFEFSTDAEAGDYNILTEEPNLLIVSFRAEPLLAEPLLFESGQKPFFSYRDDEIRAVRITIECEVTITIPYVIVKREPNYLLVVERRPDD